MTRKTIRHQGRRKTRNGDTTEKEEKPTAVSCEICFEPINNRKFKNNNICSHPFCTDCITNYIKAKLEDHQQGNIKCPDLNCYQFLDPISCRTVIGPTLFIKWCDVLCESAIEGVNRCYCPNRDCNSLILNECCDVKKKAQCPICNKTFCFNCRRDWSLWHSWSRCEDVDDRAFNRLVAEMNWRRCPRCRFFVERVFGCNNITCRCGNSFCYYCGINAPHLGHTCIGPVVTRSIHFGHLFWYIGVIEIIFLLWQQICAYIS